MLADILHKLAAQFQEDQHSYRPRPSASGPERCERSLVYHARDTTASPFPGRALHVFNDGNWHQELTADWIRKSAFRIHSEGMKVQTPVGPGEIDGILTDLLRIDRLYEHKSINHFGFEKVWKGTWPLDYLAQVALYISGLQKDNPDITQGILLLKNKNTAQFLEIIVEYDAKADSLTLLEMLRSDGQRSKPDFVMERICQNAVEKFQRVEKHRKEGTLPPRPFEVGTEYPCSYCRWAQTCWEGYEQEFEALAKDENLAEVEELETLCAYYLETSGHESEMKKEKERLRDIIRGVLEERKLRGGRVGPYTLARALRSSTRWNEDAIPPDIAEKARVEKHYEVLTIRKPKK